MKIAYICDGLARCSDKPGCYRFMKPGMDHCKHTWDPRHALNGMVRKPQKFPERFHKLDVPGETEDIYWEGDVDIP